MKMGGEMAFLYPSRGGNRFFLLTKSWMYLDFSDSEFIRHHTNFGDLNEALFAKRDTRELILSLGVTYKTLKISQIRLYKYISKIAHSRWISS